MWKQIIFCGTHAVGDCSELLDRIYKYEEGVSSILQYPISEAMIALSSTDDKNDSQEFIPFLTVGYTLYSL